MKLVSLAELFSLHNFETPDYQRGYAWQDQNVLEFWSDLECIAGNNPRHFMGTLILEVVGSGKSALVVDGQQRLTTTILLISALADALCASKLSREAQQVRTCFLGSADRPKFKYGSTHDAWPYLAFHVFKDPAYIARAAKFDSAYTQNLSGALESLRERVNSLSPAGLVQLRDKIENKLLFNVVQVDPAQFNIHVAFESINHRGRSLTRLELLKNRLIYLTTMIRSPNVDAEAGELYRAGLRKAVNSTWSDIYNWLGRCGKTPLDEDGFLRNHSLVYFKADTSEGAWLENLLFKIQFSIANATGGTLTGEELTRYLNSMRLAALLWSHIRRPRDMPAQQLLWLERIEHVHRPIFDPIILAAYMRMVEGKHTAIDLRKTEGQDKQLVELLIQIERFIVLIYLVSGRRGHTGRKDFYRLAHLLYKGTLRDDGVSMDIAESLTYAARYVNACVDNFGPLMNGEWTYEDAEFNWHGWINIEAFAIQIKRELQAGDGYYGLPLTKVLLYEYEDHLRSTHKGDRKVKWESVANETIEHIYPQDSTQWVTFNEKLGTRNKKGKRNSYCHSLGNLLLLSRAKNSSLQNNPYKGKQDDKAKRPRFANGSFSETEVASTYSDWLPLHIEKRGQKLLRFLEQRWNFSFSKWDIDNLKQILVFDKD
ncbi:DUF262 domain-containing HNH endonuclease family protein [Janthinobacterium sp. GMG1]|uniref:DUF262 domain-containing protein n=1 Tax=Janthinobacterium sp. GMG1 TaxID=3096007 RepID=UPI002ACA0459|nr:DUF262 domain-containing HNH endonuclease family protein [Janthinobacterium sp. GMG1]MDZ5632046.1 DUF262 domain-containing HNH endonuclease family protein [Janthinobacterium sp. GMG1]